MAEAAVAASGQDPSLAFLLSKLKSSSLRVKDDQWARLLESEHRPALDAFLQTGDAVRLLVYADGKELVVTGRPPAKLRKKTAYFLKLARAPLGKEDLERAVVAGELSESPLDQLAALSSGVFLPLLAGRARPGGGLPEVVAKRLADSLHKFAASVAVSVGQLRNQTVLPLPPVSEGELAAPAPDLETVRALEGAVVAWTRQIRGVLASDPDAALKEEGTHPGPLTELDYWADRATHLASICEQLGAERPRAAVAALERAGSTYLPSFTRLAAEVETARAEADDNCRFLRPLRKLFEKLNVMDDFPALTDLFKPILHTLLLIWQHSPHYNSAPRLVTLMREVCNDLIMQACRFIPGPELMQMEAQEAVDKLRLTLKVLGTLKSYYFEYRGRSSLVCPANPWRVQTAALFGRLDAFMGRCHDVLELCSTTVQFGRLERLEIGGSKGRGLTAAVRAVHADYAAAAQHFARVEYDVMDLGEAGFVPDFTRFRWVVKDLERRLASVITQGFDDCTTVAATFKLLESFEGLLDRDAIAASLEFKHTELVRTYIHDLREVADAFNSQRSQPVLPKNAAPFSGAVAWVRSLQERVTVPMERLRGLPASVLESDSGREMQRLYSSLMDSMRAFEASQLGEWCALTAVVSEQKLKQPLLRLEEGADGQSVVRINFDPELVKLLREVHDFLMLPSLLAPIPELALKVYERGEAFRQHVASLELVAASFNSINATILSVERPLVARMLDDAKASLQRGIEVLTWNSPGVDEFLGEASSLVTAVDGMLTSIKQNVAKTRTILASWQRDLMFERKEGRVYSSEELQAGMRELVATRHAVAAEGGREIARLLADSAAVLGIDAALPAWRSYADYVGGIVVEGLVTAAVVSASALLSQIDANAIARSDAAPMVEVALELSGPNIAWRPDIGEGAGSTPGMRAMVEGWLAAYTGLGALTPRLDGREGGYAREVEASPAVQDALRRVRDALAATEARCEGFRAQFAKFESLWRSDMQAALQAFLASGGADPDGAPADPPLERFEEEIGRYRAMQDEVQALPSSAPVGWIKLDARPIKQALMTWASKWIYLYTHHLQSKVVGSLEEAYAFMQHANDTLDVSVEAPPGSALPSLPASVKSTPRTLPGSGEPSLLCAESSALSSHKSAADLEAMREAARLEAEEAKRHRLYSIMACLRDLRKRSDRTEAMFKPLEDAAGLLGRCGIQLGEGVAAQLEKGPREWKALLNKMFSKREELAPFQAAEAIEVRRKTDAFTEKVERFRTFFLHKAPFACPGGELSIGQVSEAYALLDAFHHGEVEGHESVLRHLAEAEQLREQQDLFELYVADYVFLTRCMEELGYLKSLWDMVAAVMHTFADWHATLWGKINVDFLVEECKRLTKEIRQLNKAVRGYEVYRLLEERVKAMLTALPLVQDLSHPAMRERHWIMLMKATGKHFVMDRRFSLGDLLKLGLHNYVDACTEIVDRAQKELIVEKALHKIEETWGGLSLTFAPYHDTGILAMSVDDAVMEALENDNLTLQNMSGGKYVQGNPKFLDAVTSWQRTLGTVDVVLGVWADMQRKWQALESIFVGSADIRVQLPRDSERFDAVNATYLELMRAAPEVANVVAACNKEGRQEVLEGMLSELELCEKALQDYLETKRSAFPRFYFVAPADLLDILSKGTNPQAIIRHLPKNFDNVHNLEFRKDEAGNPTKVAIGMYSGEGEYVPFASDCLCDGPVEVWLQNVVDAMRAALSAEFKAAIPAYDEKPRTKWIFDNSVQSTVTVSRLFFTHEVNEAFEELEDGNEDALKLVLEKQKAQLSDLIELINGELSKNDRKKLITLCTIDVHARDVVQRLIDERVENGQCFQWQSQLRYYQNEKTRECQVHICDAEIQYMYEYIGNCGCLCITPLTDRCYITLTQAQRLVLGGAPAGPAGTGKTETVKDLARAVGVQCYVFNCSDQMDYRAMGQIYKGLAQTGAWGCFDEFNRIPVAVLSVCSTQYKSVLDALRARKERFAFEGTDIRLLPSVMAFITMNPGYPGRAELPESLKALFRPVSMAVPDLALICEIMLMAEGFQQSKILSRKFIILYKLCEDLLSKSRHYDWKLRAIKTTLYVAGGMKRAAPGLSEDKVLLRALRDFSLGKLTGDDTSIFMGLLNDLFPNTVEHVPRAVDHAFETKVREAARELGYQPDHTFCLKVSQLREIFEVRWSVFLLGPAGCGKSAIWRTLMRAQNNFGEKTIFRTINPKAVTRNELYGYLHPQTREWKEGLVSVTFRDMANNKTNRHQWIVLDGDIDAEWIESMNTVMDDNKMLTLASNERIPLTSSMRLLLEINHMNHCSPATVSRGGVIFVNADDIGWKPAVESWVERLEAAEYRPLLTALFSRYVEPTLEHCRRNFKTVVPLPAINQVQTLCKILEGVLPKESQRGAPAPDKKLLEHHFVFACVWAFGGCMLVDKVADYRVQFSRWWQAEFKTVAFPPEGTVFDYYVDTEAVCMAPWSRRVPAFAYDPAALSSVFVPTVETVRLTYLLDLLMANRHHVMFVGSSGTGKTAIMRDKLRSLDPDACATYTVNMNSHHDGPSLQSILEAPLEKKAGMRFGPPGTKRLVYFVDDLNMPQVDKYDTQSAIELLRQSIDYHGWFDKHKILQKEITNTQLVACMNPTSGSFFITPRMQRHFATFAVQMPGPDIVKSIYSQIVEGHLAGGGFAAEVAALGSRLVDATIDLHRAVMNHFLPSAVKFHYQFNLRELSSIAGGLCRMTRDVFREPLAAVRLWVHECERVFADRLVSEADQAKFHEFRVAATRKHFEDFKQTDIEARPLLFNSFMTRDANDTPLYAPVPDHAALRKALEERLAEYNEGNAVMDLVLFQQAMEHVSRITRVLDQPRGNVMLVGVGGSGKQSLARLAAHICGYDVFQIAVSSTYGVNEFKADLLSLYTKAGVKGTPVVFLMTDNQIVKEKFLVYINDLLSTGYIADLCTQEDKDNFCNAVRNEVKAAGLLDTPDNCWDFFIDKVRRYLHVVLCFSPVGDKFRVRARQFPALVSCTAFDWFHAWPGEALVSVAQRFLVDIPSLEEGTRDAIARHMAFAHQSVAEASIIYHDTYRRYNYTTPKSYLELIALYKSLLARKRGELTVAKERLESGVDKIAQASRAVEDLQHNLQQEQVIVEEKKAATQALIESIGQEKAVVDEAVEAGREDEEAAAKLSAEVSAFQAECAQDLAAAEPIIAEAEAALNSLDKASLGELKSFGSPAAEIVQVLAACMVLCAPGGAIPRDLSWNAGKKFMGNVDAFLKSLLNFDKDNIPVQCVDRVEKDYVSNPNFRPDYIRTKSSAAAGLCGWVINICKYFRIYQVVAPKRAALAEANKKLDAANKKLSGIRARVKELQTRVASLEESLMKATEDKNAAIAQAERTANKAALADRLITGLAGEYQRWTASIQTMAAAEGKLVGDVLLAAAFVSYAGPFNAPLRHSLVEHKWLPDIRERGIPTSDSIDPLDLLTDDSTKAGWANEGLPSDPLSVENGAIVTSTSRWPLLIDPQLQGIRWVKKREEANGLRIVQQSQPKYIDTVVHCLEQGLPLLIESCPEELDAVLEPVIQKKVVKRGRNLVLRIGDAEVEYDPRFRLYLQTKLSNPHYKPEVAAQTTLVNFCITEKGLEDQLLALVVDHERPELQETATSLVRQLAEYTISLKALEDNLLARLAASQGDILEDIALIEGLEETKRTAVEIAQKVAQAKITEVSIGCAREEYRPLATRCSLLYFLFDSLPALDRVYHYSMGSFVQIMRKGMRLTPGGKDESSVPEDKRLGEEADVPTRVKLLIATASATLFNYVASGLFERHKLLVATQLCMAILRHSGHLAADKFDYLLRGPQSLLLRVGDLEYNKVMGQANPVSDWVSPSCWAAVLALKELEEYRNLPDDLVASSKRWREWMEMERPEDEPLPGEWKRIPEFDRLLLFRALRPDRLTAALTKFVAATLGREYTTSQPYSLERSFQDASPGTPIFVFLSPGLDVAASVEALGRKLGFTADAGKYAAVSLGQGQEPVALECLQRAHKNGGWVLLQNIHLTIEWTHTVLDKYVDKLAEGAHPDFRLFLSAEPPPSLETPLPVALLQNSIKLTNEPPQGLRANLMASYGIWTEEQLDSCAKQSEYRSIIFALSFFHSTLQERKKLGVGNLPGARSGIGWNMNYPFNTGDLLCCGQLASNYLENSSRVPWDDLRYLVGEIMYGGHVVEDWDRRLVSAYLARLFQETLLDGMSLFPGFAMPAPTLSHQQTLEYVEDALPPETPAAFGLHPNAEIGYKLREGAAFCESLLGLQPREGGGEGALSVEERARATLDELTERIPEGFDMEDIRGRVDEFTPYVMVAIQEAERMNVLLAEMRRSLAELDLGLKGDLTMSEPMERLMVALADDHVPAGWADAAWPSLRPLSSWMLNLQARVAQLADWTADLTPPKSVWLSGLFNPQSFLTAVMQTTARRNDWPPDKTVLVTEMTKRYPDQIDAPSRDGAFVHGLTLEGARWDAAVGVLEDSRPKELLQAMPVILVRAVPADKAEARDTYACPVYRTTRRFREEVFTAQLKTKQPWTKWTTAGVAMFLDA